MNLIEKLKKHTFIEILKYFFNVILHIEITKYYYIKRDLNKNDIDELMKGFDLKVEKLTYEDFLLGDKNVFNIFKLNSCRQRIESGTHFPYGIIEDGKLVFSCWISLEELSLPVKNNYKLQRCEGLLEDAYCALALRGKGIHSKMTNFRLLKLYEAGKTIAVVVVQNGNTPSMRVQEKSGFKVVKTFYICKLFGYIYITL